MKKISPSGSSTNLIPKILVLLGISLLAACRDSDQSGPKGLFLGIAQDAGKEMQVVSQLPGFQQVGDQVTLKFDLFPVAGISHPKKVLISFRAPVQKGTVVAFESDLFQGRGLSLYVTDPIPGPTSGANMQCAEKEDRVRARLCISSEKIEFEVTRAGSMEVLASAKIVRNASLEVPADKKGPIRIYSLDEAMGRAKFLNYSIQQEAERVFQAKEEVKVAAANLIPHLRIKNLVSFAFGDISGMIEAIGSLLPFLFPSNWYHWEAKQSLLDAQVASFSSLRGNEMNATESIYLLTQRDQAILDLMDSRIEWLDQFQKNILSEERIGVLPHGSAEYFGTTVISMKEDRARLAQAIQTELSALSHALAIPPLTGITGVTAYRDWDLSKIQISNEKETVERAKSGAFELLALDALAKAKGNSKDEEIYGFINPESDDSLNFGLPNIAHIRQSQEREIERKKEEILSLFEKRAREVSSEENEAVQTYVLSTAALKTLQNRFDWLMTRHLSGDSTLDEIDFLDQVRDLQEKILLARANQISSVVSFELAESKRSRLMRTGYYEKLDAALPDAKP